MFGCTYVICTLTPTYFCISFVFDSVPNFIPIITCIVLDIELFIPLNSFTGAVKTQKLTGVPFLFELVVVVS